jgi:hypothetical protein
MNKALITVAMSVLLACAGATAAYAKDDCKADATKCAKVCATNAKKLAHKKGNEALVKQMQDCEKVCKDFAATGKNKDACHQACVACADACEKSGNADLKDCAKTCQSCGDCCGK